jgi:hypothetical protein
LARELYSGGHWSIVRELAASTPALRCFVISAGYGLIPIDTSLAPYAATFATGKKDSVACGAGKDAPKENVEWWNCSCEWKLNGTKQPRSICENVRNSPKGTHVFALSPSYLDAISDDLIRARKGLSDANRLIVFSNAKRRHGDLNGNVIPAPAEVQTLVGGALASLNVRVAAEVLNTIPLSDLTLEEVRAFVLELKSKARPRVYPDRRPVSDSEVIRFIEKAVKSQTKASYTKLLRAFRDSGRACEMNRFKSLFYQTTST